jgi:hypothetical protein
MPVRLMLILLQADRDERMDRAKAVVRKGRKVLYVIDLASLGS